MADSTQMLLGMAKTAQNQLELALNYVHVSRQDVELALTEVRQMIKLLSTGTGPVGPPTPAAPNETVPAQKK